MTAILASRSLDWNVLFVSQEGTGDPDNSLTRGDTDIPDSPPAIIIIRVTAQLFLSEASNDSSLWTRQSERHKTSTRYGKQK